MNARHAAASRRTPVLLAIGVVVLIAVVVGVIVGVRDQGGAANAGGTANAAGTASADPGTSGSGSSSLSSSSPGASSSGSSSPSSSRTSSPSSGSPSSPSTASDQMPAAPTSCRSEVAAGDRLVPVAEQSANDWRAHTQAQVHYDDGMISGSQIEQIWAATKKRGPKDGSDFATADTKYQAVQGACAKVGQVSGKYATIAARCTQRADALARYAQAARTVDSAWVAHVVMMKSKPMPADPDYASAWPAYLRRWNAMVDAAGPEFKRYDSALATLSKAPACAGG